MGFSSLCYCLVLAVMLRVGLCRYFFCRDPVTPSNSVRTTQFGIDYRFYVGSTVDYTCEEGYAIRGASTITCKVLITTPFVLVRWQPALPQCIRTNTSSICVELASPRNGDVALSGTSAEDTAVYTCNTGFVLHGVWLRQCQSDGVWSGSEPVCSTVDCGAPNDITNGSIEVQSSDYRSSVRYSCDYGHILIGQTFRVCQESGLWSGEPPICEAMDCGSPGFPENGNSDFDVTTYGSVTTHNCEEGYTLEGDKTRTCFGNGTWSGKSPKCKPISCEDVIVPTNGMANTTDTVLGTIVHFTCKESYRLVGSSSIKCQKNGLWSGLFPACISVNVDCGDPGTPLHAVKHYINTTVGSLINFTCLTGYMLVGPDSIECTSDGRWSGVLPACPPVDCGDPGTVLFGNRELTNTTYKSTVVYNCIGDNYQLTGSSSLRCLANGSWSGPVPECNLVDCGTPEGTPLAVAHYVSTTVGSISNYTCVEGYRLDGTAQRVCLQSGSWSGTVPNCVMITHCSRPRTPVFGVSFYSNYTVGSTVDYDCINGYDLIGSNTTICLPSGRWSADTPVCRPVDCSDPGTPSHGHRDINSTTFQSLVRYTCNDGFKLVGDHTRECLSSGVWSGDVPQCELIICGSPDIPVAGVLFYSNMTVGSVSTYDCVEGFRLNGIEDRICLNNGSWSGNVPSCVTITDCGFPEISHLGLVSFDSITIGSVAVYSCKDKYSLLGNEKRTCLANGEWSGETPLCVKT